MSTIKLITATRSATMEEFLEKSITAQSAQKLVVVEPIQLSVDLASKNGLAEFYNQHIDNAHPEDILVFVHDDVWFDDWLMTLRLEEALNRFEVVGVAGNGVRLPHQRSWSGTKASPESRFEAMGELHFAIGVPNQTQHAVSPGAHEVKLMDGVFMTARAGTLQKHNIRFDPQFKYHHYDLDLCRQCEVAGIKMGVWPIAMTHASVSGDLGLTWFESGTRYLEKWGN